MANLSTTYLGLRLGSPVVASSSPMTSNIRQIIELADAGVGAVVLKSIFEEQIVIDEEHLEQYYDDYPETADYLNAYIKSDYKQKYKELIVEAKKRTSIPVIASINCMGIGEWVDFAKEVERAGADAIELNIFFMPSSADITAEMIEAKYLAVVSAVRSEVSIPVAVKLAVRFTNVLRVAREIYYRKADGVVLYNRLFEPDIDIEKIAYKHASGLSSSAELHNSLRNTAQLTAMLPDLDVAVSTGIHSGDGAVKSLLSGACAAYVCSAILQHGVKVVGEINGFIKDWMDRHEYASVNSFRGLLNAKESASSEMLERVQYLKYFPEIM